MRENGEDPPGTHELGATRGDTRHPAVTTHLDLTSTRACHSSLFAVLLLVTGWWWLGLIIASGLVVLKCVSLKWLLELGLPVPERITA